MTVSGTPGTGTITLSAADTGALTFAQGGVLDGERVTYGIVDGSNHEVGVGIYTSSGTTLSRSIIRASTNSGSAISATSAAKVYITNSANDAYPNGFAYFPGKYYPVGGMISSGNGTTANNIVFRPFPVLARIVVSEISWSLITSQAASNYIVAVYNNNAVNFSPTGAPIFTSGSVVGTSTGTKTSTAGMPLTLDAGWYWTAVNTDTSGLAFHQASDGAFNQLLLQGVNANNLMQFGFSNGSPSKSFTYAAMPTLTGNPTTDSISNGHDTKIVPNIQLLAS